MKHKTYGLSAKVLCIGLLFLVGSPTFATMRSPYPAKSQPPDRSRVVIIGEDSAPAMSR